jgi:N-acetyl-gamma-glutamyl-phosphate reductase
MIAGVIGAAGYAGAELVRLLAGHPEVDSLVLGSVSRTGDRIEDIYLNFQGRVSASLDDPAQVIEAADLVFAALPSGVGEPYARACLERGISFIDLSADFRFDEDEAGFSAWYGKPYQYPELRRRSVYGLPELNRARIKALAAEGPLIIGNPGCYPTGASLGAFPALASRAGGPPLAAAGGTVIVDAASGVTGAGREPGRAYHFPECADSFSAYKVGAHRHTPEISRNFRAMAGTPVPRICTPPLAPLTRGLLSTIYIPLGDTIPREPLREEPIGSIQPPVGAIRPPGAAIQEEIARFREIYADFYRDEPFVRVLPAGSAAATGRVRQSNFCDISLHLDHTGTTLIVITAIDNMVKGAAGQAVQNMNIILGFDEGAGLSAIPALF